MKRLFLLLAFCFFTFAFVNAQEQTKLKIVYSENIQDTFFDVKFGASEKEIVKAFKKQGLYLSKKYSTDELLSFYPSEDEVSFLEIKWKNLKVSLSNGKFCSLGFNNTYTNEETALKDFETVFSSLSSTYEMNELPIEEENTLKSYLAFSSKGNAVMILLEKNKGREGEIHYYINLEYADSTLNR